MSEKKEETWRTTPIANPKGIMLCEVTSEEAQPFLNDRTIVVLPIGGSVKEHGGHLPMGTDWFVTDWLARHLTERFPVVTLPTLPYAYFPAFIEWRGSVSVSAYHFSQFVEDILINFIRIGVKKFLILDGGVSTHIPLSITSATLRNKYGVLVGVSNCTGLGRETTDSICTQKKGGHADEAETSTMLHIRPDLVHMDKTTEEYFTRPASCFKNGIQRVYLAGHADSPHGSNGNSTLATEDKGKNILEAQLADLLDFLAEFDAMAV